MSPSQSTSASKFLSLVLRHEPSAAHITLDSAGWVDVAALLAGCRKAGKSLSRDDLKHVVLKNAKKRFEFSADGSRIRASQGHSVEVELEYAPQEPPELLYHGTATRFLESISAQGLLKMERHHVHLSEETKMTLEVGARHGKPALLTILAGEMHAAGHVFYRSRNGVWLVDHVPPQFIRFSSNQDEKTSIRYIEGDATRPALPGPAIIAHICNDVGGWGAGFVLAISKRWKAPEDFYRRWSKGALANAPSFALGSVQFVPVSEQLVVANMICQRDIRWSGDVPPIRYDAVDTALQSVANEATRIHAGVHMPRIGCGLAGGRWESIEPLIKSRLIDQGIPVVVYDYPKQR